MSISAGNMRQPTACRERRKEPSYRSGGCPRAGRNRILPIEAKAARSRNEMRVGFSMCPKAPTSRRSLDRRGAPVPMPSLSGIFPRTESGSLLAVSSERDPISTIAPAAFTTSAGAALRLRRKRPNFDAGGSDNPGSIPSSSRLVSQFVSRGVNPKRPRASPRGLASPWLPSPPGLCYPWGHRTA